jgi:hypothetical protein
LECDLRDHMVSHTQLKKETIVSQLLLHTHLQKKQFLLNCCSRNRVKIKNSLVDLSLLTVPLSIKVLAHENTKKCVTQNFFNDSSPSILIDCIDSLVKSICISRYWISICKINMHFNLLDFNL